ncbi:hypothetical protein LPB140_09170 [Sphingorhabdus lutea]|uniref:Carboxyltransferase domain-containing protein n=1 Tax=Sphingorhabdus lutea TaxID=1913578 RepID=A0A1L3JCW5_9SPHN|nr:biotin-dependent carboxyltransferase family protein [Sphingorhabdus lutea]APG62929.1 hypothetical protein LPB140_09170 [Sphingorhabdus lutea]
MIAALKIINPGIGSTLQGIPYRANRAFGMPLCGPAEPIMMALANYLVGNESSALALETGWSPLRLTAMGDVKIAVAGSIDYVTINGVIADHYSTLYVPCGGDIFIMPNNIGRSCYLAISGGFVGEKWMQGNSTYLPSKIGGSALIPIFGGHILHANHPQIIGDNICHIPIEYRQPILTDKIIRFIAGPEWHLLDEGQKALFTTQKWQISNRGDRMGLSLNGKNALKIPHHHMDSSAVFNGTIQCPPNGQPYILGVDGQTSGGYPRIAQIIAADRHLIGGCAPGNNIIFQMKEPEEARRLHRLKLSKWRELLPDLRLD